MWEDEVLWDNESNNDFNLRSVYTSDYPIIWLKRFWYAAGLCGHYDGDNSNDLMFPSGRLYSGKERRPKDFSKSWRLALIESLNIIFHHLSVQYRYLFNDSFALYQWKTSFHDWSILFHGLIISHLVSKNIKWYCKCLQGKKDYKTYHVPKQKFAN